MPRSKAAVRLLNGYRVVLLPEHPKAMRSANWLGYVYEHIVVAEEKLGRALLLHEQVHHVDKDRANNSMDNLAVLSKEEHARLHAIRAERPRCPCGNTVRTNRNKFCSRSCAGSEVGRTRSYPIKDELANLLVTCSMLEIGRMYKVSDNAVRKWAKKLGLL